MILWSNFPSSVRRRSPVVSLSSRPIGLSPGLEVVLAEDVACFVSNGAGADEALGFLAGTVA